MSGLLFDTNVLLDIATKDPVWLSWSESQLRSAAAQGPVFINQIVYAELGPAFPTMAALDKWLDPPFSASVPSIFRGMAGRTSLSQVSP